MEKHADDEMVRYGYSSHRNVSFRGSNEELGVTWGEWREMDEAARSEMIQEAINEMIDIWIEDNEDE